MAERMSFSLPLGPAEKTPVSDRVRATMTAAKRKYQAQVEKKEPAKGYDDLTVDVVFADGK